MTKGMLPTREEILKSMKQETLSQDDFIEWILHNTTEDCEFRVYQTEHYVSVGIDGLPEVDTDVM